MSNDKKPFRKRGSRISLKDEIIGSRGGGWRPGGGVKLIVSDSDYDKAILIVNAYEKSMQSE